MEYLVAGVSSVVFFVMSFLVWKKKKLIFVIGHQEGAIEDKEKLARFMGLFFLSIGGFTLFSPLYPEQFFGYFVLGLTIYSVLFILLLNVKGTRNQESL
ncbi:MAG TPA: hypothetical protein DDY49_07305 [Paenibacillaceae bacterium]|nr:hypothetical protein [Paenibacillaceae bacterium]